MDEPNAECQNIKLVRERWLQPSRSPEGPAAGSASDKLIIFGIVIRRTPSGWSVCHLCIAVM